jgi:hypothetical protein
VKRVKRVKRVSLLLAAPTDNNRNTRPGRRRSQATAGTKQHNDLTSQQKQQFGQHSVGAETTTTKATTGSQHCFDKKSDIVTNFILKSGREPSLRTIGLLLLHPAERPMCDSANQPIKLNTDIRKNV